MRAEGQIVLPDGRKLAYAEFGRASGAPVLYFHGAPGSRLEPLLIGDDVWSAHALRVIAPDRPGMGASNFLPRRGFSDWPADVIALADALGLEQFSVIGNSAGGGYVAVCAARIPERVRSAVIVSGGWRMDWPEARVGLPFSYRAVWTIARRVPFLLGAILSSMGSLSGSNREKELAEFKKRLPPPDYASFAEPGRIEALAQTMREALRQGTKGPGWDMRLYVREFDFRTEEIRIPIIWFHGEKDINSPMALVRRAVAGMPSVRLVRYENEAHLSTLTNHFEEIVAALT